MASFREVEDEEVEDGRWEAGTASLVPKGEEETLVQSEDCPRRDGRRTLDLWEARPGLANCPALPPMVALLIVAMATATARYLSRESWAGSGLAQVARHLEGTGQRSWRWVRNGTWHVSGLAVDWHVRLRQNPVAKANMQRVCLKLHPFNTSVVTGKGTVLYTRRDNGGPPTMSITNEWGAKFASRPWCWQGTCLDRSYGPCRGLGPLPVFWYGHEQGTGETPCGPRGPCTIVQQPCTSPGGPCTLVHKAADACVFVFSSDSLCISAQQERGCHVSTLRDWLTNSTHPFRWDSLPHWRHVAGVPGRHHVLLQPSNLRHGDQVGEFHAFGSPGQAMIVSPSLWRGFWRPEHDVHFPPRLPNTVGSFLLEGILAHHAAGPPRRPLLVSFRGTSFGRSVWYNSRIATLAWTAGSLAGLLSTGSRHLGLEVSGEVTTAMESKPCHVFPRNPLARTLNYRQLLLHTAYAFCPGGGGPFSYRFYEALAAGAVPVITDDMLRPLDGAYAARSAIPELLQACVVRVPVDAVHRMPSILVRDAGWGAVNLRRRQQACADLLRAVLRRAGMDPNAAHSRVKTAEDARRILEVGFAALLWDEIAARLRPGMVAAGDPSR